MATNKVNTKLNTTYAANLSAVSGNKSTPQATQLLKNISAADMSYAGNAGQLPITSKLPTNVGNLKTPSYMNSAAVIGVGGGSVGKVTNEGVIIGGGAINSTFNNISGSGVKATNDLSYTSNLLKNQLSAVKTPAASTAATPAPSTPVQEQQPTTKIDSYEEFLEKQKDGYKDTLDKTNQLIEEQKQAALQNAETARQRSIVDARSSYEQNKATYGANAEALAAMGLSGSGYGDYINSQAYAQQRADTQNANVVAEVARMTAESEANQNKLSAEMSYAENISQTDAALAQYKQQQADKKDSNYVSLLDLANKGNYTKEQLAQLGAQYGLSDEQIATLQSAADKQSADKSSSYYAELLTYANNGAYSADQLQQLGSQYGLDAAQIKSLTDAATTYKNNKQNEKFNQLLNSSDTSGFDAIKSARDNGEITAEQYNKLVTSYQSYYYDLYSQSVDADFTMVNTSDIDNAYNRGYITKAQYDKLKDKYNSGVVSAITAASIFYANGNQIDEKTGQAAMDELMNTGWLTDENKKKLQSLYDSTYNDDDGGCYAMGTLITIDDGSQVPVENLKEGDNILVFNHFTGEIDTAPILFMYHEGKKNYNVLKLHFSNAADIEILYGHGFFDVDLNKYILIKSENVQDYIGHRFYHVAKTDGGSVIEIISLTGYEEYEAETECYCAVTTKHLNCVANGILTIPDDQNRQPQDVIGFCNLFDLDENHKVDAEKMAADIEKFGVFLHDDFCQMVPDHTDISDLFFGIGGEYIKVAFGKGLLSMEKLSAFIGIGADHRNEQNKQ